ncbi:MAG: NFACT family protein, partial [Firmicutes bacterium]|nr:NFACT family protein [Bacillota bacterium]
MAYDGFTMAAVRQELQKQLVGARVEKVFQPHAQEINLHLRTREAGYILTCSADARLARVHLTTQKPDNPSAPPAFCMLLRKHLSGARLLSVEQIGLERVLSFVFRSYDDFGNDTKKSLICEVMGRHSNIILAKPNEIEDPIILGSVKIVDNTMSHRVIMPGEPYYAPPTQDKLNIFDFTEEELATVLMKTAGETAEKALVQTIMGISRDLAAEIMLRASGGESGHPLEMLRPLTMELRQLATAFSSGQLTPCIRKTAEGKSIFSMMAPIQHPRAKLDFFSSVNEALDAYYTFVMQKQKTGEIKRQLAEVITNHLARNEKKLRLQGNDLLTMEGADKYRIWGEMLTASLHTLHPGMKEARVPNYYEDSSQQMIIPLDPAFSPQANAQRYFKKYRKLRDGKKFIVKRLAETRNEIEYLESLLVATQHADYEALFEVREEMESAGMIRSKPAKKRVVTPPSRPLHYRSPDGFDIYVGKNNRQNDQLTLRTASPADVWLHVKDIPGSHVIIKHSEPPEATLLLAAQLAARFSKASASNNVPVDYTHVRNVKKPKGA